MADNVNVAYMTRVENVESHFCKLHKVLIQHSTSVYAMYFENAICQVGSLEIKNVTMKESAIFIDRDNEKRKSRDIEEFEFISRYSTHRIQTNAT